MNPEPATFQVDANGERASTLKARRIGIDTYLEHVIYMRADCPVCRAEGFETRSHVQVTLNGRRIIAALNIVLGDALLDHCEAGLSESAWTALAARAGDMLEISHAEPARSESLIRAKVYGSRLADADMTMIVDDIVGGLHSNEYLSAFVTACAGSRLDFDETLSLTRAMVNAGRRLRWPYSVIADKHCVGGLPGNRTTLIVVPIIAALGIPIPKTSSRAITSPAGTADTMEVLAPVNLDLASMHRVIEREGGCIVWGGNVQLSPADDILIRVEKPLDFDSEGQLVASVVSKKVAAGSTHVLIDLPVGPTAKVRTTHDAQALSQRLLYVGSALGLNMRMLHTDGSQPVGRGIGPALEARDVLSVLQGAVEAPADLRARALTLAAALLELSGAAQAGEGLTLATRTLDSGRAWIKFQAICAAQGGMREPPVSSHQRVVKAHHAGRIITLDNRKLARIAKLAGAPRAPAAGIDLHVRIGDAVSGGEPLFTVHAQSQGELDYALHFMREQANVIGIGAGGDAGTRKSAEDHS